MQAKANFSTSELDGKAFHIRAQRCLSFLDLIDDEIIASGTFSTPFDSALEALRDELNRLASEAEPVMPPVSQLRQ